MPHSPAFSAIEIPSRSWIVAQIEAREHYAVPRALHREGVLEHLYTDAWCRWGQTLLRDAPDPLRSLANRYHPSVPSRRVTAYTGWAIAQRLRHWWNGTPSDEEVYKRFLQKGRGFGRRVRNALRRAEWKDGQSVFFGYDTGSLEPLQFLAETNCFTIVDQVDPARVDKELILEEVERWPGWATSAPVLYEPYQERRRAEWEYADAVVVNSEWSKGALVQQGVEEGKIHVVPLAYDASETEPNLDDRSSREGALRVLWLSRVSLRKGIQYLIEAAEQLEDDSLRLDIVGPLKITEEAVACAPSNMAFHGRVPRDEVSEYYRNADVFVLPTLSDGFAITQLEAMAHGLPVVTTPNCGRVVTDGEDGWIIPPRDSDALAETLTYCASHRGQLRQMAERAHATSKQYTLGAVADALRSIPPAT